MNGYLNLPTSKMFHFKFAFVQAFDSVAWYQYVGIDWCSFINYVARAKEENVRKSEKFSSVGIAHLQRPTLCANVSVRLGRVAW